MSTQSSTPPPTQSAAMDALIKQLVDSSHGQLTTAQAQQIVMQSTQAQTSGFPAAPFGLTNNVDQGTLFLGQGNDPNFSLHPGLPSAKPNGTKTTVLNYLGTPIQVTTPDFGKGYKIELHTTWGHTPSAQEIQDARNRKDMSFRIWVEIRGSDGKPVFQQDLDENQINHVLAFAPTGSDQKARANSGPISLNLDPYAGDQGSTIVGGIPQVDQTGTIGDQLKGLYNMDPNKLRSFKHELWAAGYYGTTTKLTDVNMTTITDADVQAFGSVMMEAARYFAAGKKITWQSLLQMEATDPSALKREAAQSGSGPVPITDPETVIKLANDTGTKVLGRAPSPQDVQTLIQMVQSHDVAYGKAQQRNTGSGTAVNPDPTADVEAWLRKQYPAEAMAMDWGSAAADWNQMLASSSPQPRIVNG